MRVLVLSNLYPPDVLGGYELGCRQVVDALRARGHEVRVLTSAPRLPVPPAPDVYRALRLIDIWSHYLFARSAPVTSHLAQWESHRINAHNVHVLLEQLAEFRPDVVYLWMIAGVGGLGLLGCLHHLRVPWVWHLMDDVPLLLCTARGRVVPALAGAFNRQLRGTYLACSEQLVDEVERGGIALRDRVEVVPNWVAGPLPPPRGEYLPDGRLRIVSAAGLIERQVDKGIDLLIEAAALLRERGYASFEVDVYGRVTDPSFPTLVRRRGLDAHVRFLGARPQAELTALYAGYDVFAFPTRPREPFGFAPLEAAAAGCVPVLSATCGIAEWLVHGVHALKAPRRPEAFARIFAAILDRRVDPAALGRRVAAVVRRDFHLDAVLPRIERALESAARRDRAGAGTADEAYRMAVLAERLAKVLIQESLSA